MLRHANRKVQAVEGALDNESQRLASMVADMLSVVFDCLLYNLTRAESPMLVHFAKDKNEQASFVRLV